MGRAIELNPGNPLFYLNFGPLLFAGGMLDEAEAVYRKAISLKPVNPGAWNNLGNVYEEKEDFGKAIECYLKAVAQNASFAEAWKQG